MNKIIPHHSVCITNGFCGYIRLTENKPIIGSPIRTDNPLVLYVYEDVKSQTYTWLTTAFFWIVTQRVVAISYRCFGATYRVPSSGVENPIKTVFFRLQAFAFAFSMLSCGGHVGCGTACSELLLMWGDEVASAVL